MVRQPDRVVSQEITPDEAARLGDAWLEMGLGEHASVAAFARFVLHLLSLGAPPEILRDAIKAMDDEVVHARLCFGLAKRFTGRAARPGPMDLSGVFSQRDDPSSILEAAIREGCVMETISARYAQVALERAEDRGVRAALTRIADDESRHADLSWRFVSWMLQTFQELKPFATTCFARALTDTVMPDEEDERGCEFFEQYGQLISASKRQVMEMMLRDVIRPRAVALLGTPL